MAGKVTASLAEINGSLPPGLCYLQADCLETVIGSILNAHIEHGIFVLFFIL